MMQPPTFLRYLKHCESSRHSFHITGTGVDERMPPCIVNRPKGTRSWLIMQFHSPVRLMVDSGEISWFPSDSVMVWNETDGHYYGNPDQEWSHSWVHCVGEVVDGIVEEAGVPLRTPFVLPRRERFNELSAQLYRELTAWRIPDEDILLRLLEIMFKELGRAVAGGVSATSVPERLISARSYMERNVGKRISLADLAERAGLSIPQFCAEFKRHMGRPPIDYLIGLRMEMARGLLGDVNRNISEVARSVGYDDPFQFSKLFKKRFGVSPRETRCSRTSRRRAS